LAIFSAKNWLNTSTPIAEDAGVRPRPSRASAVFHRPRGSVKGQGHQAALLSAALTREAGAAVTVRTYWAWETTATLCLLCGAQGAGRPRGRRGTGTYRVATRTACYRWEQLLVDRSFSHTSRNIVLGAMCKLHYIYSIHLFDILSECKQRRYKNGHSAHRLPCNFYL